MVELKMKITTLVTTSDESTVLIVECRLNAGRIDCTNRISVQLVLDEVTNLVSF